MESNNIPVNIIFESKMENSMRIADGMDPVPVVKIIIKDHVTKKLNTEPDLTFLLLKNELIHTEVYPPQEIICCYSNTRHKMTLEEMKKQVDHRSRNLNLKAFRSVFLDIGPNYVRLVLELNPYNNISKAFFNDMMFHGPNLINGKRFGDVFNDWPQYLETQTAKGFDNYLVHNINTKLDIVRIRRSDLSDYEFLIIAKICKSYFRDSSLERLLIYGDMIIEGGGIILPHFEVSDGRPQAIIQRSQSTSRMPDSRDTTNNMRHVRSYIRPDGFNRRNLQEHQPRMQGHQPRMGNQLRSVHTMQGHPSRPRGSNSNSIDEYDIMVQRVLHQISNMSTDDIEYLR